MPLLRAITRDTSIYPDPNRFLDPEVPPAPGFGYGRRYEPPSVPDRNALIPFRM